MKIYMFFLVLIYHLTLAAQPTLPLAPDEIYKIATCKTESKTVVNTIVENDGNNGNTVIQLLKSSKNVHLSTNLKMIRLAAKLKNSNTITDHGNLLLSSTTSEAVRTALSKIGYNLSFISHTSGSPQSMPFTSVVNVVLSEVNFY